MLSDEDKQKLLEQHEERARLQRKVTDLNVAEAVRLSEAFRRLKDD